MRIHAEPANSQTGVRATKLQSIQRLRVTLYGPRETEQVAMQRSKEESNTSITLDPDMVNSSIL